MSEMDWATKSMREKETKGKQGEKLVKNKRQRKNMKRKKRQTIRQERQTDRDLRNRGKKGVYTYRLL